MTQKEFDRIKRDFDDETKRFEALVPGQIIYQYTGYDNFAHEIVSVDVPNRQIHCLDHSIGGKKAILSTNWSTGLRGRM